MNLWLWQLVFQMSSGLVLKATTMFWSWICLDLVLKTCSISVAGNFLSSPSSCLLIKWYISLSLLSLHLFSDWLRYWYSDNPCWVFPFEIFPSPRPQARQFPHGARKTRKPGFLSHTYMLWFCSHFTFWMLLSREVTLYFNFMSKGIHHRLWSC